MDKINITNVYSFQTPSGQKAFFYSVRSPKSPLAFSYYALYPASTNNPIRRVEHAIDFLQNQNYHFIPISQSDDQYTFFIKSLAEIVRESQNEDILTLKKKPKLTEK